MAKEYIEREAAKRAIMSQYLNRANKTKYADVIDAVPAADVVPVVHGHKVTHNRPIAGHWVSGELDGGWDGMAGRVWVPPIENNPVDYCSECGKRLDDTFQKYCPNCGATMDKDGDAGK